jgi:hypothetical protein
MGSGDVTKLAVSCAAVSGLLVVVGQTSNPVPSGVDGHGAGARVSSAEGLTSANHPDPRFAQKRPTTDPFPLAHSSLACPNHKEVCHVRRVRHLDQSAKGQTGET